MIPSIQALIDAERLPHDYGHVVERWWRPLARAIAGRHARSGRLLVGINGGQGTGKSTLCLMLETLLRGDHALEAATLSLDDLYLTREERLGLARDLHPLFATRGVPGTHDIALGRATIDRLLSGEGMIALPRFDKAVDDRAAAAEWPVVEAPVDIVLFEGWCVGATPLGIEALREPVNALERDEDADGRWRTAANRALSGAYAELYGRLDLLVMLAPPGFDQIRTWRQLQEEKLHERTGRGMDEAAVSRFVDHYERLTRHMLAEMPGRADILVRIDADHKPHSLIIRGEPGTSDTRDHS